MILLFQCTNLQSGLTDIPCYLDVRELLSWNLWIVPDDAVGTGGIHRSLRGKKIVVLNFKQGLTHWTGDSFDAVSSRILEALTKNAATAAVYYKERAEIHAAQRSAEIESELHGKKSPLAV